MDLLTKNNDQLTIIASKDEKLSMLYAENKK